MRRLILFCSLFILICLILSCKGRYAKRLAQSDDAVNDALLAAANPRVDWLGHLSYASPNQVHINLPTPTADSIITIEYIFARGLTLPGSASPIGKIAFVIVRNSQTIEMVLDTEQSVSIIIRNGDLVYLKNVGDALFTVDWYISGRYRKK